MRTLKATDSRPSCINQVNLDPRATNKSIDIPTLKLSQFRSPAQASYFRPKKWCQGNFDPYSKMKSNFDAPQQKNNLISIESQTKYFLTAAQKPSQFRCLHSNQVNFDHPPKQKSALHWDHVKRHPPHWKQANFDCPHWNHINFDAHTKTNRFPARAQKTKSIPPAYTKTKSIDDHPKNKSFSAFTQEQSQVWPPLKNQVNFDTYTKAKQISIPHTKSSFFGPQHWGQVNFDPNSKNQVNFDSSRHKNQVNFNRQLCRVISDRNTKTKSIPKPTLKLSQFRSPTIK